MKLALDSLYPSDTFNLITFSGDTRILFPQPVRATRRNLAQAQQFLAASAGGGGTEMMGAIKAALEPTDSQSHVRIVCFMTDGYVGNDMQIIAEVQKHKNARVFAFGIGSSVNRFLLDNLAIAGREVEYVGLNDDGSAAARRFHQRVRSPLLTDITIDWNDLPVGDIYPQRIPDLFGAKPVILTGRYTAAGSGTIRLKGNMAGSPYTREIQVTLPETMALHDVLAPLWARSRIDNVMSQDYTAVQLNRMRPDLKNTITQLGMEFRLMTQFTSFVAVEEMVVTDGGRLRRIDVPVDVPAGVDRDRAYGAGAGGGPTGLFTVANAGSNGYLVQGFIGQRNKRSASNTAANAPPTVVAGVSPAPGLLPAPAPPPAPTGTPSGARPSVTFSGGVSSVSRDFQTLAPAARAQWIEQQKLDLLRVKTHATIFALITRLKNKNEPRVLNWEGFVREGNAEVQVWLTAKSDAARMKLKELGFEVILDSPNSTLIVGRLPMDKVELLAELEFVRYISPQISR
jgi:Ca-activated chloride channel family protein